MPFSILVIDDDPSIRLLLRDVLEEEGYTVYEAADGVAGLQQFKLLQPDLVSLDITMPRLDGLAVLKEIRRQNAVVGVLMISALRSTSVVTEASANGADGYLYKPFKLEALLGEIQRVGGVAHIRRSATSFYVAGVKSVALVSVRCTGQMRVAFHPTLWLVQRTPV